MSHRTFSDNFPTECILEVYAYASTQSGDARGAEQSALVIIDYIAGLKLGPAEPGVVLPQAKSKAVLLAELAAEMKPCCESASPDKMQAVNIDWKKWLALLLELLPLILADVQKQTA